MSPRRIVLAASLSAVALVFTATNAVAALPPKDRTPPTTPTNLRITVTTATSMSLAWNPSTDKFK